MNETITQNMLIEAYERVCGWGYHPQTEYVSPEKYKALTAKEAEE